MTSRRLFPVVFHTLEPVELNSRYCKLRGIAHDGQHYYIKRLSDHPRVPAAEVICTEMARDVGLATPLCCVGQLNDGEEVFASREETDLTESSTWLRALLERPHPTMAAELSRWLAFDLFVANDDRHVNNFLMRLRGDACDIIGIDFSEAWHVQAWPMPQRLGPGTNTLIARKLLRKNCPIAPHAALVTLEKLAALPADWLESTLCHMPVQWLPDTLRGQMCRWWKTGRAERIARLTDEFANGHHT